MSKLSKAFKKLKKSAKKTVNNAADDAGKALGNAAEDAGKGIAQAADATGDGASALWKDAEKNLGGFFKEIDLDAIEDQIEKWIDDVMLDALEKQALKYVNNHKDLLDEAATVLVELTSNKATNDILQRLCGQASKKQNDSKSEKDMTTLMATPSMKRLTTKATGSSAAVTFSEDDDDSKKDDKKYNIRTMAFGTGFGGGSGVGLDGSVGFIWSINRGVKNNVVRTFLSAGAIAGMIQGGAVNLSFELITSEIEKSEGPFLALQLEVECKAGGGVAVIWNVPTNKEDWGKLLSLRPAGYMVRVGGGKKLELAICGGYTVFTT